MNVHCMSCFLSVGLWLKDPERVRSKGIKGFAVASPLARSTIGWSGKQHRPAFLDINDCLKRLENLILEMVRCALVARSSWYPQQKVAIDRMITITLFITLDIYVAICNDVYIHTQRNM